MPPGRLMELRIHGVSGDSAADLLEVEPARRVAGDEHAGFFRRRRARHTRTVPGVAREAFAWANLTSGASSRALWLLLLPFLLVNIAYWMRPRGVGGGVSRAHRTVDHVYGALTRLLALSLTVLLTLAAAGIGMDLIGWQCAGYGTACAELRSWLAPLAVPGASLATPGRALAAGALLPLGVVALLWRLSRRTGSVYEAVSGGGTDPDTTAPPGEYRTAPLSAPEFWRGHRLVGRLRSAHIAAALAAIALLLVAPPLDHDRPATGSAVGVALFAAGWLTVALSAVAVLSPAIGVMRTSRADTACRSLRWVALALLATAVGYAVWPRPEWRAEATLPGYATGLSALFALQCVVGVLLLVVAVLLYRGGTTHADTAMWGMAGPVTATLGTLLGGVLSATLGYQTAELLSGCAHPGAVDPGCLTFHAPRAYTWLQLTFVLEAGIALLLAGALWLVIRRRCREHAAAVAAEYGRSAGNRRTRRIAMARTLGSLTEYAPVGLAALVLPVVALVLTVSGVALSGRSFAALLAPAALPREAVAALAFVGGWLGGILVAALVWLGRSAYRDRPTRQAVGVLWDVGTFWPRAAHPLAPPSYAERAVPQLVSRVAALTRRGWTVVLSGHSQGSVLAAATVWQLPRRCRDRVMLLTHGAPLDRLYARYFPAYFGPVALGDLRARVADWRNLWRETDAIGGPITPVGGTVEFAEALPDPRRYGRPAGEVVRPEIMGHSGYTRDPAYRDTLTAWRREVAQTSSPGAVGAAGAADVLDRRPHVQQVDQGDDQ